MSNKANPLHIWHESRRSGITYLCHHAWERNPVTYERVAKINSFQSIDDLAVFLYPILKDPASQGYAQGVEVHNLTCNGTFGGYEYGHIQSNGDGSVFRRPLSAEELQGLQARIEELSPARLEVTAQTLKN